MFGLKLRTIPYLEAYEYDTNALCNATYLLIGVGNLGTRILNNLCKIPHKEIILIDHDYVGEENIGYQELYTVEDIGKKKVDAAKDRVQQRYPWAKIKAYDISVPDAIEDTGDEISTKILKKQFKCLNEIIGKSNIVVISLDSATVRLPVWLVCMKLDKPFIDIGFQENFGNIFLWVKGYQCPLCFIKGFKIKYNRTYYADPILVEVAAAISSRIVVDYICKKIKEGIKIDVYEYNIWVYKIQSENCKHYVLSKKSDDLLISMRKIYKNKFYH